MAIVFICDDCGRGYEWVDFRGQKDTHGSRPIQCPNCYAYLGRTEQDLDSET
jgi:DNA-directed RNA polymerase subunit RPC12/RpoP